VLHGSFANTSADRRVTINYGFHKKSSVLNILGGGLHGRPRVYDEKHIIERSRLIQYAISARSQKYPNEKAYIYRPLEKVKNNYIWNDQARKDIIDYSLLDMSI
jgi:hypothetical protein